MAQQERSDFKERVRRTGIVVAGVRAVTLFFVPGIGALMLAGGRAAYYLSREKQPQ